MKGDMIRSRDDVGVGDRVRDPLGQQSGTIVDLTPSPGWRPEEHPEQRVVVAWGWSRHRSEPRVTELVLIRRAGAGD